MHRISVQLAATSYEVCVRAGLYENLRQELENAGLTPPFLLVSQNRILKAIGAAKSRDFVTAIIPDGERAKTLATVNRLIDLMVKKNFSRESTVVAVGGGVVGDVAGFVASIYLRGVNVVQVPTTLLAQVDSSIGGKTAVNHRAAKNLIGTFYQPRLVLADPVVLQALPEREYLSGLYEALKYGVIRDPVLFREFEKQSERLRSRDVGAVERLVAACAAIKAHVVMADEREGDLRRILNFGHTVGHALEFAGRLQRIRHGEAVGYGMIAATRISAALGKIATADGDRIDSAVRSIGRLPYLDRVRSQTVFEALQHDKKVKNGAIHFVLPRSIGQVEITPDVPVDLVRDVIKGLLHESKRPN